MRSAPDDRRARFSGAQERLRLFLIRHLATHQFKRKSGVLYTVVSSFYTEYSRLSSATPSSENGANEALAVLPTLRFADGIRTWGS